MFHMSLNPTSKPKSKYLCDLDLEQQHTVEVRNGLLWLKFHPYYLLAVLSYAIIQHLSTCLSYSVKKLIFLASIIKAT